LNWIDLYCIELYTARYALLSIIMFFFLFKLCLVPLSVFGCANYRHEILDYVVSIDVMACCQCCDPLACSKQCAFFSATGILFTVRTKKQTNNKNNYYYWMIDWKGHTHTHIRDSFYVCLSLVNPIRRHERVYRDIQWPDQMNHHPRGRFGSSCLLSLSRSLDDSRWWCADLPFDGDINVPDNESLCNTQSSMSISGVSNWSRRHCCYDVRHSHPLSSIRSSVLFKTRFIFVRGLCLSIVSDMGRYIINETTILYCGYWWLRTCQG